MEKKNIVELYKKQQQETNQQCKSLEEMFHQVSKKVSNMFIPGLGAYNSVHKKTKLDNGEYHTYDTYGTLWQRTNDDIHESRSRDTVTLLHWLYRKVLFIVPLKIR